jgi:hypothetical protein
MGKTFDFFLGTPDPGVTARLKALGPGPEALDRRYTQEEDFFLVLDRPFEVDSFEIHHDVADPVPSKRYRDTVNSLVESWGTQIPGVFQGLSWYFDPRDLFHPLFLQVLASNRGRYLFVLRPDLTFRGHHGEVVTRGTNSETTRYASRHLFLEAEVLPLQTWDPSEGVRGLALKKLFPLTFQGEEGSGYFATGRWLDTEISKVLSRAALPAGTRTHPHYPLRCRFETLSARCATPTTEGRRRAATLLEVAWPLVEPWADRIQADLATDPYRDDHPLIGLLRAAWGDRLSSRWGDYRIEPILNEHDQKEYRYHGE